MHQEFTLSKLKFKNFRPFKDWQELSPKKLNIFIGPNNSGKSSLSELLSMLSGGFPDTLNTDHENLRAIRFANLAVDLKNPIELKFEFKFDNRNFQQNQSGCEILGFMLTPCVEVHLKYFLARNDFPVNEIILSEIKITDTTRNITILEGKIGKTDYGDLFSMSGESFRFHWMDYYDDYLRMCYNKTIGYKGKTAIKTVTSATKKLFPQRKDNSDDKKILEYFNHWGNDGEYMTPYYDTNDLLNPNGHYMGLWTNRSYLSEKFVPGNPNDPFEGSTSNNRYNRLTEKAIAEYLEKSFEKTIPELEVVAFAQYKYYFFYNLCKLFDYLKTALPGVANINSEVTEQSELYSRKKLMKLSYFFEEASHGGTKERLNKWLKQLGITDSLEKIDVTEDYLKLMLSRHNKKVSLHLLGHGTQQIVFTVLALQGNHTMSPRYFEYADGKKQNSANYRSPSGIPGEVGTLNFVREPETNLHPKFQSHLADLLVDTVNRYYAGIVVETHSEYLVRKLQYLIAKKEISHEDVELVYFEEIKGDNESGKIRVIPIRKDGFLMDDFGPGFFDESARWTFELFRINQEN